MLGVVVEADVVALDDEADEADGSEVVDIGSGVLAGTNEDDNAGTALDGVEVEVVDA